MHLYIFIKKIRFLATIIFGVALLVSCVELHQNAYQWTKQNRIFLYISCPSKLSVHISFVVSAISFMNNNEEWINVVLDRCVDSDEILGKQVKLTEFCLPPGHYVKMKWKILEAKKKRGGEVFSLALPVPEGEYIQDIEFVVFARESSVLFVDWYPDESIFDKYLFQPKMVIRKQNNDIKNVLLYVTNSGSDSVTVINRQHDMVVGSVAVARSPRGIVATPDGRKVYVANSGSNNISVIDPGANRVINTISNFSYSPVELALSDDGRWLYATNSDSDNVSVIDTVSSMLTGVIPVGQDPGSVVFDGRRAKLYVANRGENSISIIDVNTSTVESTVTVGLNPSSLAIFEDKLYVANSGSSNLFVIAIPSYTIEKTIPVLQRPVWIQPGLSGRIYLSSAGTNEISFIYPLMGMIFRNIPVGNLPGHMAIDSLRRKLYVVNSLSDDVSVVDLTDKKVKSVIQVGKKPYGIVVIEH